MDTIAYCCATRDRARLVLNWLNPSAFVGLWKMSNDAGSRISRATVFVKSCWIVRLIGVVKLAMRVIVLLVKLKAFISVNVGSWR